MKSHDVGLPRLLAMAFALAFSMNASAAADADAAKALAKSNGCFKCHSVDKEKDGPSFKATAAKYKGKPDGEQALITHLTTGPDGHMVVKAKDPAEVKNLSDWILEQ
jgi:cytochrome c